MVTITPLCVYAPWFGLLLARHLDLGGVLTSGGNFYTFLCVHTGAMHSILIKGGVLISGVVLYTSMYVAETMHCVLIRGCILISCMRRVPMKGSILVFRGTILEGCTRL